MNVLIAGAWPYANGSLHIGHIAALLPGDVLARYFRANGHTVFFVSGSDCHGTPVAIRARQEGLRDRSLTRDLDWGIDVPKDEFAGKKIYIWAENVLGYLSDCYTLCSRQGLDFNEFWNNCRQYYVHGKDNIPFHTIILPSLLLGRTDIELKLPDEIISSEYLTLEGKKISTSNNWAIWAKDILERYSPDSIRYFLISNGPEKRDTDFTWQEFINSHNGELLGAYGNFVNRSLVFIQKYFEGKVPEVQGNPGYLSERPGCIDEQPGCMDELQAKLATSPEIINSLAMLYPTVGTLIEHSRLREALDSIFTFVRSANKFFDEEQPWITVKNDPERCKETLNTCVQIIANLSLLLEPFLPFSSEKVRNILKIEKPVWRHVEIPAGFELGPVEVLFERIDKKAIQEETVRLKNQ